MPSDLETVTTGAMLDEVGRRHGASVFLLADGPDHKQHASDDGPLPFDIRIRGCPGCALKILLAAAGHAKKRASGESQ